MTCKESAIVYLDQNNIFHRYKKLNFVKLLEYLQDKYDIIRTTSFNAISNVDEGQKKFVIYLSNNNWRCETVDINENTNIDSAITTNMINDIRVFNHKVCILISGDGDYGYPLKFLSQQGYIIHVIGVKDHVSLELLKVCDRLTYLEAIKDVIISE